VYFNIHLAILSFCTFGKGVICMYLLCSWSNCSSTWGVCAWTWTRALRDGHADSTVSFEPAGPQLHANIDIFCQPDGAHAAAALRDQVPGGQIQDDTMWGGCLECYMKGGLSLHARARQRTSPIYLSCCVQCTAACMHAENQASNVSFRPGYCRDARVTECDDRRPHPPSKCESEQSCCRSPSRRQRGNWRIPARLPARDNGCRAVRGNRAPLRSALDKCTYITRTYVRILPHRRSVAHWWVETSSSALPFPLECR